MNPKLSELHDQFFYLLEQYRFSDCEALLYSMRFQVKESEPFIEWLVAILYIETNRWDDAERCLFMLSKGTLHPRLRVRVLNELGIVADYLGRLSQSTEYYIAALKLLESLDDPIYQAKVLKNASIAYVRSYESGQAGKDVLSKALGYIQQSLQIFQSYQERYHERHAWNELGTVYKALGQWRDSLAAYQTAQKISREINDLHSLAVVQKNIGEVLILLGQFREAREYFSNSIQLFEQECELYEKSDALAGLGETYSKESLLPQAGEAYRQAIESIESLRHRLKTAEVRADFFATQIHVYGNAIEHALVSQSPMDAFDISERARARGLLELLDTEQVRPPLTIATTLLAREQTLRDKLTAISAQDTSNFAIAEQSLAEFYRELNLLSPQYASLRTTLPTPVIQLLEELPDDTAIFSWFATQKKLIGFVSTKANGVRSVNLPIALHDLLVSSLDQKGLPRSLMPGGHNTLSRPWILEKIHSTLLAPLLDITPPCKRLLLIPDGLMHRLPLHAAYDSHHQQFLCDRFEIVYAPSATIQMSILSRKGHRNSHSGMLSTSSGASDLRYSLAEAQAVAHLWNGKALLANEATSQHVLEQARTHRYLHIASHAYFHPRAPLLSGIDFADKRLTAWDFLQVSPLGCDLVFVNGCESGVSQVQSGNEWLGLVRALLYAVAPSLLLTLWKIDDLAARIFAQVFYRQLRAHPPAEARRFSRILQNSVADFRNISPDEVRSLLVQDGFAEEEIEHSLARLPNVSGQLGAVKPFAHPYFWAAYVLVGEVWQADIQHEL